MDAITTGAAIFEAIQGGANQPQTMAREEGTRREQRPVVVVPCKSAILRPTPPSTNSQLPQSSVNAALATPHTNSQTSYAPTRLFSRTSNNSGSSHAASSGHPVIRAAQKLPQVTRSSAGSTGHVHPSHGGGQSPVHYHNGATGRQHRSDRHQAHPERSDAGGTSSDALSGLFISNGSDHPPPYQE